MNNQNDDTKIEDEIEEQRKQDNRADLFLSGFEEYWEYYCKSFSYKLFDFVVKNKKLLENIDFKKCQDELIEFKIDLENILLQFYNYESDKKSIYDISVPVESYFDDILHEYGQKDKMILFNDPNYFNQLWCEFVNQFYSLVYKKFNKINQLFQEINNNAECDDSDFVTEYALFSVIEAAVDISTSTKQCKRNRKRKKTHSHYQTSSNAVCEFNSMVADSSIVEINKEIPSYLNKYWFQRYRLFSKYDDGVLLDEESWFSATPEKIAIHQAKRCSCDILIDPFCGSGSNIIQFAATCGFVVGGDIDIVKLKNARHNLKVYNKSKVVDFVLADALYLLNCIKADIAFISAPWGGPESIQVKKYNVETMMKPPASDIVNSIHPSVHSIAMFIPRNTGIKQLVALSPRFGCSVEIEDNLLNEKVKAKTAYFGEISSSSN